MCDWKVARAALEPCKSRRPTLEDILTIEGEYVKASEGCSTYAEARRELAIEKVALYLWVERPNSALAQPNFGWGPSSTLLAHLVRYIPHASMSGKYAFTNGLKEIRFLFCQSSENSAAAR